MDYWAFVVIYLTGGWVGGVLTQVVVAEVVARRSRERIARVMGDLDADLGRSLAELRTARAEFGKRVPNSEAQIAQTPARFSPPASSRTRPSLAARTPGPVSSA